MKKTTNMKYYVMKTIIKFKELKNQKLKKYYYKKI